MADDHVNAQLLATELAQIDGIELVAVNTNMLFIKVAHGYAELREALFSQGIIFPKTANKAGLIRLATHLDVSHSDILRVVTEIKQFMR